MFNPDVMTGIETGGTIEDLSREKLRHLQRALAWLTYPISLVDGRYGPNTRSAFGEFTTELGEGGSPVLTDAGLATLIAGVRETIPVLRQSVSTEAKTRNAIVELCRLMGLPLKAQIAYVLATAQWETAHTFRPVREGLNRSDAWRRKHLRRYYPFYGRGYVQLTWHRNYDKYGRFLDMNLKGNPDLALRPDASLFILVHGFITGAFTGRKLKEYINDHQTDFKGARRCINGADRWQDIKDLAERHLADL